MKYGIVKLREEGLISYNMAMFEEGEEVIAFPMDEFRTEMLRLKYYLDKAGFYAVNILDGKTKYKKQELFKAGAELRSAKKTMDSLTRFEMETSLDDFDWPDVKTRSRKRLANKTVERQASLGVEV